MRFRFLEHTADMKFQAYGKSLEEAFKNAALALREVISGKIKVMEKISKRIEIEGRDFESLLYNFLEELLFLLDAEGFLFSQIKDIKIDKKNFKLKAVIFGDKAKRYDFTNEVKAITYNEMFVKKEKNKYVIQAVLDV